MRLPISSVTMFSKITIENKMHYSAEIPWGHDVGYIHIVLIFILLIIYGINI